MAALPKSPLELRLCRSINAGDHGEHRGTLCVAGDAAVGELRRFRAIANAVPCFVSMTGGAC